MKGVALVLMAVLAISFSAPPEKKCRLVFSDLNRRELKRINECTKELGWKTGREKSLKSTCTMKCVLQKENMLKPDGQVSYEQFDNYLEEHFPVSLQKRGNDTFRPCLDLFEGKAIDDDEFCKAYEPLTKCLSRQLLQLCRGIK